MAGTNVVEFKSKAPAQQEILAWLRLIRSENIGPMTFYALLRQFGTAEKALEAVPELAKRGGRRNPIKLCSAGQASEEIESHHKHGAHILIAKDPRYPSMVKTLSDAPPVISALGQLDLLNQHSIAMVGARNASLNGKNFAHKIAYELGKQNWVIASGLARGVDTNAHHGVLTAGGDTIAVVAGGVDNIYPPENEKLYQRIASKGVVISEAPFGVAPQSLYFPRRNRLISGLSYGVVVIEAAKRSGSLITARFALEQGREVFAVPGSPLDPRCHGSNDLIRQGATLIQSTEDITEVFKDRFQMVQECEDTTDTVVTHLGYQESTGISKKILENLSTSPISIDDLSRHCATTTQEVLCALLELELAGKINRFPGNQVALVFNG